MATYRSLILADSPSLYWPLDATYGATDQSGNGRNGTGAGGISIGAFASSPISGETTSTDFDGSNDRVRNTSYNPFTNSTVRTFEGWANRDTEHDGVLIADLSAAVHVRVRDTSHDIEFLPNNSAAAQWSAGWPANGTWVHWALIFTEATNVAEFFINGVSLGTDTASDAYGATSGFEIGINVDTFSPWNGKMAHVDVYERALTASEIQSHYIEGIAAIASKTFLHEAGRGQ